MEQGRILKGNLWQRVCLNLSGLPGEWCFFMAFIGWVFFFGLGGFSLIFGFKWGGENIVRCGVFWTIVIVVFYAFLKRGINRHVFKSILSTNEQFLFRNCLEWSNFLIKADAQGNVLEFDEDALLNDGNKIIEVSLPTKFRPYTIEHPLRIMSDNIVISILCQLTLLVNGPFQMQEIFNVFERENISFLDKYFIKQLENIKIQFQQELAEKLQCLMLEKNSLKLLEILQLFKLKNEFSNIEMITFEIKPDSISYSRIIT